MTGSSEIRRRSLDALTGARFLAAFYVVLFHFASRQAAEHRVPKFIVLFLQNGYMGVPFFFILSGFVLAYSYSGRMNGWKSLPGFWEARFARVYPVYLLSLVLNFPFRQEAVSVPLSKAALLAVLTGTQTWNPRRSYLAQAWNQPAWTLSVEAFFYLCFPFLLPICTRLRKAQRLAAMVCLAAIIVFFHTAEPLPQLHGVLHQILSAIPLPIVRVPEFLLGVLIGQHFLTSDRRLPFTGANLLAIVSVAGAAALLCTVSGQWLTLTVVPFAVFIYAMASGGGVMGRWLSAPVMVFLGGASYSVYLLQFPVRNWVRVAFQPLGQRGFALGAAVSPVLLVLVSCLVFHWYEEPARRFLRKWFGRVTKANKKEKSGEAKGVPVYSRAD